jgi:hypothetical protein
MWSPIIVAIVEVFGPMLAEWLAAWLKRRLTRAAAALPDPSHFGSPAEAHKALLRAAAAGLALPCTRRRRLIWASDTVAANHVTSDRPLLTPAALTELSESGREELVRIANEAAEE